MSRGIERRDEEKRKGKVERRRGIKRWEDGEWGATKGEGKGGDR